MIVIRGIVRENILINFYCIVNIIYNHCIIVIDSMAMAMAILPLKSQIDFPILFYMFNGLFLWYLVAIVVLNVASLFVLCSTSVQLWE